MPSSIDSSNRSRRRPTHREASAPIAPRAATPGPLGILRAIAIGGTLFLTATPLLAGQDLFKELSKALESKVRQHLGQELTRNLIRYDRQGRTLAVSPILLRLAGSQAQQRLGFASRIAIEPTGDRLGLEIEMKGGSKVKLTLIPRQIELSLDEMAITGLIPGGVQLDQAKDAATSLTGLFDTMLGIGTQVGKLMKHVAIEGETFRLKRPLKISALGRALASGQSGRSGAAKGSVPTGTETDPKATGGEKAPVGAARGATAGTATRVLPLTMRDGWLTLELKDLPIQADLADLAVRLLLMRLENLH